MLDGLKLMSGGKLFELSSGDIPNVSIYTLIHFRNMGTGKESIIIEDDVTKKLSDVYIQQVVEPLWHTSYQAVIRELERRKLAIMEEFEERIDRLHRMKKEG